MTVIGLIVSIIAYGLLGDWQAILADPCTKSSIFHHPELQQQYVSKLYTPTTPNNALMPEISNFLCERSNVLLSIENMPHKDIYVFPITIEKGLTSGCELVSSCPISCTQQDLKKNYSVYPTCLHLRVGYENQCLYLVNSKLQEAEAHQDKFIYSCSTRKSQLKLCIYFSAVSNFTQYASVEEYVEHVHIQTVQVIERRLATLAENICEGQPHHSCHWNPHSEVTGRYCEDCPPICRDKSKYLQFSQFVIGAGLLLVCGEIVRVPMIGILSDIVDKYHQVSIIINYYNCIHS